MLRKSRALAIGLMLVVGALQTGVDAAITSVTGDILQIAPPPSVVMHALESNEHAFAFDELQDVMLTSDLPVDITVPGVVDELSDLTPGVIPAGTVVRSHLIHSDRVGVGPPMARYDGAMFVDKKILGVSVLADSLNAGDPMLGWPTTTYPTGETTRKLNFNNSDLVRLIWTRTEFRIKIETGQHLDQIRVITLGEGVEQPAIDIEKHVKVLPDTPDVDLCEDFEKPKKLTMQYTGDGNDATSHSQDSGKVVVTGDPNDASPVFIIAADKNKLSDSKTKRWFQGQVALGDTFVIDAATKGASNLASNTFVFIYNAAKTTLLQTVFFHTSCSQPLHLGDQFGSVKLTGFTDKNGNSAVPPVPDPGIGDDADIPTGPTAAIGDDVKFTYVVTNPGDVPLSDIVVSDDNATPDDPSDDFNPDPKMDGGFNVGDTNQDGRLDPGEEWIYCATLPALLGQHTNLGTVTGTSPDGADVSDADPANYLGECRREDDDDDDDDDESSGGASTGTSKSGSKTKSKTGSTKSGGSTGTSATGDTGGIPGAATDSCGTEDGSDDSGGTTGTGKNTTGDSTGTNGKNDSSTG